MVLASFRRGVWVSEASELPGVCFSPKRMLAGGVFICGMGFLVCGEGYCFTPLFCGNLYFYFICGFFILLYAIILRGSRGGCRPTVQFRLLQGGL